MLNGEFRHWLAGYFELSESGELTSATLWIIKNHLNLVFAVERFLEPDLLWLDEQILALSRNGQIASPPKALTDEIRSRFHAPLADQP